MNAYLSKNERVKRDRAIFGSYANSIVNDISNSGYAPKFNSLNDIEKYNLLRKGYAKRWISDKKTEQTLMR